jgi:hypothetical protein
MGFEKIRAPEKVFKLINDFWAANKMNSTTEVWSIGDMLTYVVDSNLMFTIVLLT